MARCSTPRRKGPIGISSQRQSNVELLSLCHKQLPGNEKTRGTRPRRRGIPPFCMKQLQNFNTLHFKCERSSFGAIWIARKFTLERTGPSAHAEGRSNHASLFIRGMRDINSVVNVVQMIKWPHLPLCWAQHRWWLIRKNYFLLTWKKQQTLTEVAHPPTIKDGHLSCQLGDSKTSSSLSYQTIPQALLPQKAVMKPIKQK